MGGRRRTGKQLIRHPAAASQVGRSRCPGAPMRFSGQRNTLAGGERRLVTGFRGEFSAVAVPKVRGGGGDRLGKGCDSRGVGLVRRAGQGGGDVFPPPVISGAGRRTALPACAAAGRRNRPGQLADNWQPPVRFIRRIPVFGKKPSAPGGRLGVPEAGGSGAGCDFGPRTQWRREARGCGRGSRNRGLQRCRGVRGR